MWPSDTIASLEAAGEEKALTEYERDGLARELNLADGHAYHDLGVALPDSAADFDALWAEAQRTPVLAAEARFRDACAALAGSAVLRTLPSRICPTASNSIDIAGAVLRHLGRDAHLVEPTFDNLALILRRRGVALRPVPEARLHDAALAGALPALVAPMAGQALFVVQPNNPTGTALTPGELTALAEACVAADVLLLLDNSFRFFRRDPFDDYAVLAATGVSFIALEDTGKVWPTHDLKASLLVCSEDLRPVVDLIYDEIFLCHSRFALLLLERCLRETHRRGLAATIWDEVDRRRAAMRAALAGTPLRIAPQTVASTLSVEWIACDATGLDDEELTAFIADEGLQVLPGHSFFWASPHDPAHRRFVRLALLKPQPMFDRAIAALARVATNLPNLEA